jgi:hypothetical protein
MNNNSKPSGLDLPETSDGKISAVTNPTMGTKASLTNTKNHNTNMVKTLNRSATKNKAGDTDEMEDLKNIKESFRTQGKFKRGFITPLRESSLVARIEQLLENSKIQIEELHNLNNKNFATAGAGPQTGNKGTESYMQTGQKPTTANYNNQVRAKIDDDMQRHNQSVRNASKVEPQITPNEQTLGIKAPIMAGNMQARLKAANNHEQSLANKEQEQASQGQSNG